MSSFKDKLKNMAADKKIAAHPLVDKLNANQNTRSSYWLVFALYAKVDEKKLDTQLTDLGKSLKLDDMEIKDELSAVNGCSSDEDFESLVQECANGIADSIAKILLFVELNQFGKRNKMSLDFLPDMMSIMELPDSAKDFVNEFNTIVNSTKPNLLKFYNVTKKFPDIPVFVYESFASDLWAECSKDLSKEASGLVKIITENFSDKFWQDLIFELEYNGTEEVRRKIRPHKIFSFSDLKQIFESVYLHCNFPVVNFYADQEAMKKKYKEIEDSFIKEYYDVQLPMVKLYVFQQYCNKLQTLFSGIRNYNTEENIFDTEILSNFYEILALRYYLRFSAGLMEQYIDDGFWIWNATGYNKDYRLKELDSIIAVYEEENKKLSASLD